jgi:DNA-binding SARP family transcriptional activator
LATSFWAGQFSVAVVGFGSELDRFDGVTSHVDPADLIRALYRRRIVGTEALRTTGYRSFAHARQVAPSERWAPLVVVCGPAVAAADVAELIDVAAAPVLGSAVVAVGERMQAQYSVRLTGGDWAASLELLGTVILPQRVEPREWEQVSSLVDTAATRASVLSSEEPYVNLPVRLPPSAGDSTSVRAAPARPRATATLVTSGDMGNGRDAAARSESSVPDGAGGVGPEIVVAVLGPIEIRGAMRPFTRAWAEELVVYLAMHPKGASNEAWSTALWPDRLMAPSSLHSTASVARRSLGQSANGSDHLPRSHGRLALAPTVGTDWDSFVALAESDRPEQWHRALALVRGRPFEGLRSSDWPILEGIAPAIEAAVVDLSGRLAGSYLRQGNAGAAEWAARRGLVVSRYDERLYRMLMRAADAAGNPAGVDAVMAELLRLVADEIEPLDAVHPSTMDLYRQLSRRRRLPFS